MRGGVEVQGEAQRSTAGATDILAAPGAAKRYYIKDVVVTGGISATGLITIGSTTKTIAKYNPTYGHPKCHFSGRGYMLELNEALVLTEATDNVLVNVCVMAEVVG
jgi:hypothetical protein